MCFCQWLMQTLVPHSRLTPDKGGWDERNLRGSVRSLKGEWFSSLVGWRCVQGRRSKTHLCIPARSRPSGTLSAVAGPSGTSSGYAFMRAPSGSNISEGEATVTGKRSFMYCTCNLLPAAD